MNIYNDKKDALIREIEKLHYKNELSAKVGPDYYEPGMMEYLDKFDGTYDPSDGMAVIRFDSKGVRYDGRSALIEKLDAGDAIQVVRDKENIFNSNNFRLTARRNWDVGNIPAELCNAIAPLYDGGYLTFEAARISYIEPISKRSRYAKQPILFIELVCRLTSISDVD